MPTLSTPSAITPERHSRLYWALSDSWVLIHRSLRHMVRNTDQLLSVVFQPIMFMLLFRYVFGGAIDTGGTSYVNFLVAGILVQTAAFGATTTAIGVNTDLKRGIIDRFRSLPMFSSAVLVGHVAADLVRNVLSTIIMLVVAFFVGFNPTATPVEWLLVLGMLLVFTLAISWLSAILGQLAGSVEAVQWFSFVVIFPLTFASSAFVPTEGMPTILRVFAENQPVTLVIESIRAWLVGTPIGDNGWRAFLWCAGMIAIAMPLATIMYKRQGK